MPGNKKLTTHIKPGKGKSPRNKRFRKTDEGVKERGGGGGGGLTIQDKKTLKLTKKTANV